MDVEGGGGGDRAKRIRNGGNAGRKGTEEEKLENNVNCTFDGTARRVVTLVTGN